MIQVDVFWSFAMGAMFAYSSKHYFLRNSNPTLEYLLVNWYFVYGVLFLSIFFAPSGAYLLWQHTAWETMFYFRRADLHGLLPTIFASTNVLLGVIGFIITARLISKKYQKIAFNLPIYSYGIMFSILGFGYKRFLFAGNENDWRDYLITNQTHHKILDFFHCEVFITLLVMGIFIIPPLYYSIIYWPIVSSSEKYSTILYFIFEIIKIIIIGSLVYAIYIFYLATPHQLSDLSSLNDFDFLMDQFDLKFPLGHWSPLVGFIFAEIGFFLLVLLPFLFTVPTRAIITTTKSKTTQPISKKRK